MAYRLQRPPALLGRLRSDRRQTRRKMLVLCPYPVGVAAGQRLKFEQYYDDWREAGWDITVSPYMDSSCGRSRTSHGHLWAKFAAALKGLIRRIGDLCAAPPLRPCLLLHVRDAGRHLAIRAADASALAKASIYDIEDNVLIGQRLKGEFPNPLLRLLKGSGKAKFLVRRADHVITSSPFLNDALPRDEREARLHLHLLVRRHRPLPAREPLHQRAKRQRSAGPARSARASISTSCGRCSRSWRGGAPFASA